MSRAVNWIGSFYSVDKHLTIREEMEGGHLKSLCSLNCKLKCCGLWPLREVEMEIPPLACILVLKVRIAHRY